MKFLVVVTPPSIYHSVTPGDTFACYDQVIMIIRNPGKNVELDINRIFIDYDSNIIVPHRNALHHDEGRNGLSKPDLDTIYKPDIVINKCN